MLSSRRSSAEFVVRWARPGDEGAISSIYAAEYGSGDSGDVDALYPFPQFFDPEWVRLAVESDNLAWVVAEYEGEIIGSFGAALNIGRPEDGITELFGLVVSSTARQRGAAKRLFNTLMDQLRDSHFVIAETRTATKGGWRTVRGQGFLTLGFEPFAHMTPAGSESMILFGCLSQDCQRRREVSIPSSRHSEALAREVLQDCGLPFLPATDVAGFPITELPWCHLKAQLAPMRPDMDLPILDADGDVPSFSIVEDSERGPQLHAEWAGPDDHASGVVGLNRLEGRDSDGLRYAEKYFVARIGRHPVMYARVVWDHVDRRARILFLRTLFSGLQGLMLAAIVDRLEKEAGDEQLVAVVDVRADCPELQTSLAELNFFPTVYYPGLISNGSGRVDAVQYTRLHGLDYRKSANWVPDMAWQKVERLVGVIGPPAG